MAIFLPVLRRRRTRPSLTTGHFECREIANPYDEEHVEQVIGGLRKAGLAIPEKE